jgi:ABC-2 type transport system ATP-binding protein
LRKNLWNNVKELNKVGVTIILTTHYLFEAQEMCDRIAIINKGNLVALDTTQKLLDRIQTKKITLKVEKIENNLKLKLEGIDLKISSENTIVATFEKDSSKFNHLLDFLKLNNLKILDIATDDGDLEDVFVQLTKS